MSGYATPVARATAELVPVSDDPKRTELYALLERHENFPKDGVTFIDTFTLFRHVGALKFVVEACTNVARDYGTDVVAGVESRGMVLGPLIAVALGVPFIPIRKAGKLPGKLIKRSYALEYGTADIEVQVGIMPRSTRAIIIDDLLATGGTLAASVSLLGEAGYDVRAAFVLVELEAMSGARTVGVPVFTMLKC